MQEQGDQEKKTKNKMPFFSQRAFATSPWSWAYIDEEFEFGGEAKKKETGN